MERGNWTNGRSNRLGKIDRFIKMFPFLYAAGIPLSLPDRSLFYFESVLLRHRRLERFLKKQVRGTKIKRDYGIFFVSNIASSSPVLSTIPFSQIFTRFARLYRDSQRQFSWIKIYHFIRSEILIFVSLLLIRDLKVMDNFILL